MRHAGFGGNYHVGISDIYLNDSEQQYSNNRLMSDAHGWSLLYWCTKGKAGKVKLQQIQQGKIDAQPVTGNGVKHKNLQALLQLYVCTFTMWYVCKIR